MPAEDRTRLLAEGIARAIDRRAFLKQASTTVFALIAALVLGRLSEGKALADDNGCSCSPPGPYCSNCRGADCYMHDGYMCYINRDYYPTGCWSSYCNGRGRAPGYYMCCDCFCNGGSMSCGCRDFRTVGPPVTHPTHGVNSAS